MLIDRAYVKVWVANGAPSVAVTVPSVVGVPPLKVSVTVIVAFTRVVGVANATPAVPFAEASGVNAAVLFHEAVPVFVPPSSGFGARTKVHVYAKSAELLAAMLRVPFVTVQVPPLSIASLTVVVIASQSFGLLTVIVPDTAQALSTNPVCAATTV